MNTKTLGEMCEIIMGQSPPSSTYNTSGNGLPFFQGKTDFGTMHPTTKVWCSKPLKVAEKGDILISVRAPVGPTNIAIEKCCIGRGLAAIRPRKQTLSEYVLYFLRFIEPYIAARGQGSTFQAINKTQLETLTMPNPSQIEQKQIASTLSKLDRSIQKCGRIRELSDNYPLSLFHKMFGNPQDNDKDWDLVQVQELFDMKLGKMLSAKNYTGRNLKPYLRNVNIQWDKLDLSDIKKMDFDDKDLETYRLKPGDILVCEGGEVGRTAIYNGEIVNCCYQNALHRLRIKQDSINPIYFVYFMMLASRSGLIERDTTRVTIAHFTQDKFKKFLIPLPPLPIQNDFAMKVLALKKIKETQLKSVEKLNLLLASLSNKYFNIGVG